MKNFSKSSVQLKIAAYFLIMTILTIPSLSHAYTSYTLVAAKMHPVSMMGKGSCSNLGSGGDVVQACAVHTINTGFELFYIYTQGAKRGRCCPKKWAWYDINKGMQAAPGDLYRLD